MYSFFLISSLFLVSTPVLSSCPGCPEEAKINQDIVNFAMQELLAGEGGQCNKSLVKVENFTSQVVSGTLYKFNLVLKHHQDNQSNCQVATNNPETCHMVVHDIPWQNKTMILWDQVDCAGRGVKLSSMGHKASGNKTLGHQTQGNGAN